MGLTLLCTSCVPQSQACLLEAALYTAGWQHGQQADTLPRWGCALSCLAIVKDQRFCKHSLSQQVSWSPPDPAGFPPLPVHRLDMNTSGVLVLAKDSASAADLHAQFRWKSCRLLCLLPSLPGCAGPVLSLSCFVTRGADFAALRLFLILQAAHCAESLSCPRGRGP